MTIIEWIIFSWIVLWIIHIIVIAAIREPGAKMDKLSIIAYMLCAVPITWFYIWIAAVPIARRHCRAIDS